MNLRGFEGTFDQILFHHEGEAQKLVLSPEDEPNRYCIQFYHRVAAAVDLRGRAEDLHFPEALFDAFVKIESAHCYRDMEGFVAEVYRVLRPGEFFCILITA